MAALLTLTYVRKRSGRHRVNIPCATLEPAQPGGTQLPADQFTLFQIGRSSFRTIPRYQREPVQVYATSDYNEPIVIQVRDRLLCSEPL